MLIPYNTDAPLYHWPIATVGMIALNTLVFFGCENPEAWMLHYGTLRPWEWVTSNFIHADIIHLGGNMVVLWGLGLVVEGKVGWWRFLLIFLGIGVAECALEQIVFIWLPDGGSFGASAIVYGLVAMALIWAPRNDLSCILIFGYVWALDVSLIVYAVVVLGLEIGMAFLTAAFAGAFIGSAILHLMGAFVGAAIAVVMLKLNWVDCEGFDLFAVISGREGQQNRHAAEVETVTPELLAQRKEMAMNQIRHLIAEGQPQLAHAANLRMQREHHDWALPAVDSLKLIAAYHKAELWADSIPLMVQYLKNHTERTAPVRLQLAKVLIQHEDRPAQAERVLAKIAPNELNDQLRQVRDRLLQKAKQLRAEGVFETAAEDW